MDKVAIYIIQSKNLSLVIPKKKQAGFYRSCFGYHNKNEAACKFEDEAPEWFVGDTCDLDGYLSIDLKLNTWDKRFEEGLQETLKVLKSIFPYVSEFKEDDKLFWEIVL